MEANKNSPLVNMMLSNPTIAAAIFVAATPVYPMIMGIKNADISKLNKKLHYLSSLKKKSAYHIKHINGIQSILKLNKKLKK